jgi:phage terminase large subunit
MGRTLQIPISRSFVPLLQPSRYKGLYGGRGSGKSHVFAELLIDHALVEPGLRAVCVREVQKSLEQSVKRLLEDKIATFGLRHQFRITQNHIETPGGGIFIFQGMQNHTADSIKSLEGYRRAWVEEAQSLSDRSLTLLRPTLREEGSEIWFSWNPELDTDPVDRFLRSATPPPDAIVLGTTWRDNSWFPDVLRKEMEWDRQHDREKYEHVWEGAYQTHAEARVFKNFKVEYFDTPSDAVLYFGADWGFSVDPAVCVRLFIQGRTLYIDHEAYEVGCEIDHLPALFDKVPGSREWESRADSARPETISYMQRHGYPHMEAATKGKDSVKEGIIFLQGYDIILHPRCVHAIDEFKHYSYQKDRLTGRVIPLLEDKKNHVIDSVRYAIERVRATVSEGTWGR